MKLNNTIELVGHGHPDRFADYISEKVLVEHLKQDKEAKVAVEVMATKYAIILGGEITSKAKINYKELVHGAIKEIYGEKWWPNLKEVEVINKIAKQSPELTTIQNKKTVAGDQGVVYGYYNFERVNKINALYSIMKDLRYVFNISPDWKLLFNDKELSMSVCGDVDHSLVEKYLDAITDEDVVFQDLETIIVNPKGKWLVGGALADTGMTGRKLMIDTFGAGIPHGGGAFCGKDPSKVDKTGIIIATKIAKDYAEQNIGKLFGEDVIVELNYKIGDEKPRVYINGEEFSIKGFTLDKFIKDKELLDKDWAYICKKGGIVSTL